MPEEDQNPPVRRDVTQSQIQIIERADSGKEFIVPALRNFREKISFSILLLIVAVVIVGFTYGFLSILEGLPFEGLLFAWVHFIVINFLFGILSIPALCVVFLAIICFDLWFRSSRIIAVPGELRVVTHWLFFKWTNVIPTAKIIETKAANNTTVNETRYYDIMVLAEGDGKGWLAAIRFAIQKPKDSDNSFAENDLKVLNTGGEKIRAITNIIGETEAKWMLEQLRAALGINV